MSLCLVTSLDLIVFWRGKIAINHTEIHVYVIESRQGAGRQLEVLRNSSDGGEKGSMLWLLDHTRTAMGGRLLRAWVAHPLRNPALINERLDALEELAAGKGEQKKGKQKGKGANYLPTPRVPASSNHCLFYSSSPFIMCAAGQSTPVPGSTLLRSTETLAAKSAVWLAWSELTRELGAS